MMSVLYDKILAEDKAARAKLRESRPRHSALYAKLLAERTTHARTKALMRPPRQDALVPHMDAATPLFIIAEHIGKDPAYKPARWCAEPYRAALSTMDTINDTYGADSAREIVAYLVSNLGQYRGPRARAVKIELRKRLKKAR